MTLLAILAALLAEHVLGRFEDFRGRKLLLSYYQWLQPRLARWSLFNSELGVLLIVLPDVLLVALLYEWLQPFLWGLPALVFAMFMLWHAMGPHNLYQQVRRYLQAMRGGDESQIREAASALSLPGNERQEQHADDHVEHQLTNAILVESNKEIFSALFWFVVAGPAGAAGIRFLSVIDSQQQGDETFRNAVAQVRGWVVWAPARLQAAGYALAGSMMDAWTAWRKVMQRDHGTTAAANERLLLAVGHAALLEDMEERSKTGLAWVEAAMSLLYRTVVVWVAAIALLTLANLLP